MSKESFILYGEQGAVVNLLSDEQAGKLFKLIFNFVDDQETDCDDIAVKIAFEPIKQALIRNQKKYQQTVDKRAEAGKMGNLKRYYPDLFDEVSAGNLSIQEAEEIAKSRKSRKCENDLANLADNEREHDNDNERDNDNDILLKKESKRNFKEKQNFEIEFPFDTEEFKNHWKTWKEYKEKQHRFKFKSKETEQASLKKLTGLAKNEKEAIQIIQESVAQGWKGFYELQKPKEKTERTNKKLSGRATINFDEDIQEFV